MAGSYRFARELAEAPARVTFWSTTSAAAPRFVSLGGILCARADTVLILEYGSRDLTYGGH